MSAKVGRNDLCHCGSGKKYKRCHLAADEADASAVFKKAREESRNRVELPENTPDLESSPSPHEGPKELGADRARILAQLEVVSAYTEKQEDIEAATTKLNEHLPEFNKLLQDKDRYAERCAALFSEERFASLRFSADSVRRAFEYAQCPHNFAADKDSTQKLLAAILRVAEELGRPWLSMELLLHLPEYVSESRYLDGWLIHDCALATAEETDKSNPFLFQMFYFGYDAWTAERRAKQQTVLREVGFVPESIQNMDFEEIEAWVREQTAEPDRDAKLREFFEKRPDHHAELISQIVDMERNSLKILERADAAAFLLPDDEVAPWLSILAERYEKIEQATPEREVELQDNPIIEMLPEMAQAIFTPERVQALIRQLDQFRKELFTTGEKDVSLLAATAKTLLEREKDLGQNYFLTGICFYSLRRTVASMASAQEVREA